MPFWQVKGHLFIHAELGEIGEAEKDCEEALEEIRLRLQANRIDLSVLPQEGWTMYLLRLIKKNGLRFKDLGEYRNQWIYLSVGPFSI